MAGLILPLERLTMKKLSCISVAISGLFVAGLAFAAPPGAAPDESMHGDHQMHGDGMKGDRMPPMFNMFDENKDGKLSKDEVHKGVDKMFTDIDTNKDGFITKEEMQAHHKAMHDQMQSKMQERWKAADKDGDGALSRAEVDGAGMKMLSRDFDKLDKNKDGKLTPDEIRRMPMMRHQGEAAPSTAPK